MGNALRIDYRYGRTERRIGRADRRVGVEIGGNGKRLGCRRLTQAPDGQSDVNRVSRSVENAVLRDPALDKLSLLCQQVAGGVDLKIAGASEDLLVFGSAQNEEPVPLHRRIVRVAGALN